MKKITFLLRNTCFLVCTLLSSYIYSQTVLGTYDFESGMEGWTLGGGDALRTADATYAYSNTYSLQVRDNSGNASAVDSPLFSLNTYDKVDFKFFFASYDMESGEDFFIEYRPDGVTPWTIVQTFVANNISGKNADFQRDDFSKSKYSKTVTLLKTNYTFPIAPTGQFRVRCDGSDNNDRIYLDLVTITGTTYNSPTTGPGGVTSNLDLWLRADKLDGTTVGTDGANVSKWTDNGKGNHAKTVVSGQEPVYRNNVSKNINFNPVIEFENNNATSGSDLTYINTRDELKGTGGFNSNDIFVVVVPDPTITTTMIPLDTFTSTDPTGNTQNEDVTGFGYGGYTARFTNELLTYCIGTTSGPGNGYGRASLDGTINYNNIGILNFRHNSGGTGEEIYLNSTQIGTNTSDAPDFAAVNNTRYWLGRSQYWNGSFDGRMAEVITYDARKTDGVSERMRIESYLAIKYGITLGVNGTSQNYVNSSGNIIWDATANAGYNYDVAGIGRDDASDLNQKQSKSVNETSDGTGLLTGILTMGLTDIYNTNSDNISSNPTAFNDREFLVWGNNGTSITLPPFTVNVDMSAGIAGLSTPVTFDGMQRIWKVVETGGDIPKVKVSIPQNAVRNISPPGSYLMFISSTPIFDPTADYRVMSSDGFGNLETEYDFDGTKFITFGYAPEVVVERSVYFDGIVDYIDVEDNLDLNPTQFTVSAWIKRTSSKNDVSIFSKRDATFSEGYDFLIEGGDRVEMIWNGGSDNIRGNTAIPVDEWHHVAVIYSGGTANLYIDGVLDKTQTGLSNPTSTTQSFIIAAAGKTSTTDFFEGNIDEVRVWNIALNLDQLHYIMNQEIQDNSGMASGKILPTTITRNEISSINWSSLAGYYPMSRYTYTNTNDESSNNNQGALRNLNTVDFQTAPLPYGSNGSGNWDASATWKNGSELYVPGSASIVDPNVTIDWNIVSISHNITMDNASLPAANNNNRTLLSLIADSTKELTVSSDNGLTVTHYLELNGLIDLEGESQLIQTDRSVLNVGANGSLERDQQGTSDLYTYNYWSSPVGAINSTATNATYTHRFTLPDVLSDGTNPLSPGAINWITTSVNGSASPFGLADYWIWKFANGLDDDYSSWQHVRSTGTIYAGEGYTMKGPGTGSILTPQNYIFKGKPNNGDIALSISAGNDYLVGNPYASAIDAHKFITDNPDTSGTLYFWEHWGGGSHVLFEYQGGYGTYNYSGGIPTASYGTNDPDVATGGTPTKLPGRYIPVSQGFFVYSSGGGTITFKNDQRVFEKEGVNSVFVRTASNPEQQPVNYNEDTRMKLRIGFDSFNTIHRQLLLTIDENASIGYDWGYDGPQNRLEIDDMFWLINNQKYGIQGINQVTPETVLPLGIHVRDDGNNSIQIDHLENVPDNVEIYVRDNELHTYHDLRESAYDVYLTSGDYLDRFAIVFSNRQASLDVSDFGLNDSFEVYYNNQNIVIHNLNLIPLNSVELFNIIGQSIFISNDIELQSYNEIQISNLSSGTYIIKLETAEGKFSKKVLVE